MSLIALSAVVVTGVASAQESKIKPKVLTEISLTPAQKQILSGIRPGARPNFPDLTVEAIRVVPLRILQRDALKRKAKLRVRIEVDVRNLGSVNYESNANQQSVYLNFLYDDKKFIGELPFKNVNAGAKVKLVFETDWDWMSSEEFPQGIKAAIGFDPDIYIDGNTKNDDVRVSNNSKEYAGIDIQRSLRAYAER